MAGEKETIEFIQKILIAAFQANKELTEALMDILDEKKEFQTAKLLSDTLKKGEDVNTQICRGVSKEDWGAALNRYGVPHVFLCDPNTGALVCVTRKSDEALVRAARAEILEKQKCLTKITFDDLKHLNYNKNLAQYKGLSDVQVKIFTEYARNLGFVMAATKENEMANNKDSTYTVYVSTDDKPLAEKAYQKTIEDSLGVKGKYNNQKYRKDLDKMYKAYETLENTKTDTYFVSTTNPKEYLHITGEGYDYQKGRKTTSSLRTDDHFAKDAMNYIAEMDFIQMSKSEFERINEFAKKFAEKNNMIQEVVTAKILTFAKSQYDGNINQFFENLDSNKIELSIKEDKNGIHRLSIKTDDYIYPFNKRDLPKVELEKDIVQTIEILDTTQEVNAQDIIEQLEITEDSQIEFVKQYVQSYNEELYAHKADDFERENEIPGIEDFSFEPDEVR